jgi:hypothetical protein
VAINLTAVVGFVLMLLIAAGIFGLLRNVLPRFSTNNIVGNRDGDSVFVGQLLHGHSTGCVSASHGTYRFVIQFSIVVGFAVRHLPFGTGIGHVLGVRAEKHVSGVHTRGVISSGAVVAQIETFGNLTADQFPRDAGDKSHCLFPIGQWITDLWSVGTSIAPEPTTRFAVRLFEFRPEAVGKKFRGECVTLTLITAIGSFGFNLTGVPMEKSATLGAVESRLGRINFGHDRAP